MKRVLALAAVCMLLVAACASDDDGGQQGPAEEPPAAATELDAGTPTDDERPLPVLPGDGGSTGADGPDLPVVSPDLALEIDRAIADLATSLGADGVISVTVAHELTWPDGSLGCPQPGMMYTQALVDGYRIELTDGESLYQYHGAKGEPPFRCRSGPDSVSP